LEDLARELVALGRFRNGHDDVRPTNLEVERENEALELRHNEIGPENEVAERDRLLGRTIGEDMIETTESQPQFSAFPPYSVRPAPSRFWYIPVRMTLIVVHNGLGLIRNFTEMVAVVYALVIGNDALNFFF
jgi:hypothetical protein